MHGAGPRGAAIEFQAVNVTVQGRYLLHDVTFSVPAGARLIVIGRNGAGKTTLFGLLSAVSRPSSGTARVLGEVLGRCDMRELRKRIGIGGSSAIEQLDQGMTLVEAVLSGIDQVRSRWWLKATDTDRERAEVLLDRTGLLPQAHRSLASLSMGERQQVGIARALVGQPELLLLDEPTAGLDLGAREEFIARISSLAAERREMTIAMITHHVEEIPPGFDHVVGVKAGELVADGPLEKELSSAVLSDLFDAKVALTRLGKRYVAFAEG
ncbi:MAG: ATP-binding cassette domain-containing protein [Actinomycetota bacterium]|nr:ATP-binding cassette domain-containing protein [Actinomycetota bacterium]